MRILMVLTSHDRLGDTGRKTGFWLDEFATPYYVFKDAGAAVELASPDGGQPPTDPRSEEPEAGTPWTTRLRHDLWVQTALANTVPLSLIKPGEFDAAFYPGGHGLLWDLIEDSDSIRLIESFQDEGKPLAFVSQGAAALCHARARADVPLVRRKSVTAFANSEEEALGLAGVVPVLPESMLRASGGRYSKRRNGLPYAVVQGGLVTGQNPASSEIVAHAVLRLLRRRAGRRVAAWDAEGPLALFPWPTFTARFA